MIDHFFRFLGSHTNDEWERFIAWLLMMGLVYFMLLREDQSIKIGLRGENKLWESVEVIVYMFIYMLPGILLSNFFLQYAIDDKEMWIIEAILLTALGVRGLVQTFGNKNRSNKNETTTNH